MGEDHLLCPSWSSGLRGVGIGAPCLGRYCGIARCTVGRVMKPKKSLGILALYFFVDLIYIKTGKNKILKKFKFFIVQKLHFSRAENTKDFLNL